MDKKTLERQIAAYEEDLKNYNAVIENVKSKIREKQEELDNLQPLCDQCSSYKLVKISAKCSDICSIQWWKSPETGRQRHQDGYVPSVLGLGDDSDYVDFTFCATCGQIQNYESKV